MKKSCLLIGLLLLALAFPVSKLHGQAVYGSIIGTVLDSSGGAVPNAKVTITDIGKDVSFTTSTNEVGHYAQTHLIVGRYRVRVEAPGFQAYVQENVDVSVDAAVKVDATLQVGAITQTVEVTAEVPLLKTERTDVATTFSTRTVEELPIFNRNFTQFVLLSPGTQMLGWQHASSENPQGSIQIMVNGQSFGGTSFELDGTDNRDPILGIIVINPTLDSVGEMKITTQNYDAEFGQATAGIITAQTKSGTNDLHGSAFLFRRNDLTMARQPFSQSQPLPYPNTDPKKFIPDTLWNQFGGSLGGPIRKNKTFIFGDYQGTRRKNGGSVLTTVPTELARTGDLSEYPVQIFDPVDTLGNELAPEDRVPFTGNIIPQARMSLEALNLLGSIPLPNISGAGINNNFAGAGTEKFNDDAFNLRLDHYWSEKLHLFGRYSFARFKREGPGAFGELVGGPAFENIYFSGKADVRNQSLASGFDYSLRPNWLTDFRFAFFRYRVFVNPNGLGTSPAADAGIPGLNLDSTFTSGMPAFYINGEGGFSFGYSLGVNQCNCPLDQEEQQWQFVNNWTNILGNHTLKFGGDIRFAQNLRVPSDSPRSGALTFNPERTQGAEGGGLGLASFLLGDVSHFERFVSKVTDAAERQKRWFFYGQDTWRITPKLTLTYGLRWELYFPQTVTGADKGGWVQLSTGEDWIAGTQGVGMNGNVENTWTNLAPRLGLAYQIKPKTVIRMGYGRSFDVGVFGVTFGHTVTQNLPVLAMQSVDPANSWERIFNLAQGPSTLDPDTILEHNCNPITDPSGTQEQCLGATGRPLYPDGVTPRVLPPKNKMPSVDAWNFTLQHQLTPTLVVEAAYVGNKGTHVYIGDGEQYNINMPRINGYGTLSTVERQPFYNLYGWTQGVMWYGKDGNSSYNSLQTKIEKRFTSGYQLLAHYTWARARNQGGDYWPMDGSLGFGPPDWQRSHVFTVAHIWELPFGKGRRFLSDVPRALDYVIGGWAINGTTMWASGMPFGVGYLDCGADVDTGPCRPDMVGKVLEPHTRSMWYMVAPIALSHPGDISGPWRRPQPGTFGNAGRNPLRGPGLFNGDMSFMKKFRITEKLEGQFRAEAYNLWNHVNLGNPDGCVDCETKGQITGLAPGASLRQFQFAVRFEF